MLINIVLCSHLWFICRHCSLCHSHFSCLISVSCVVISDEGFFLHPLQSLTQFLVLRTKNVNLSHYNINIKNTKPEMCTLIIQWLQLASTKTFHANNISATVVQFKWNKYCFVLISFGFISSDIFFPCSKWQQWCEMSQPEDCLYACKYILYMYIWFIYFSLATKVMGICKMLCLALNDFIS